MERLTARRAACDVLVRVMHHDSYANLCVKQTAPRLADERERAFFAALVYGVLEKRVHLECALSSLCRMKKLPPETVEALYLGAYQILFLDGVPQSAAVSESVALVRRKSPRLAGMANAVLRNAARQKETLLAIPSGIEGVMRRMNLPRELAEKWIECYGEGETPLPRKTGVRVRDVNKRGEVSAFLLENADVCEPYGDDCFVVQGAGDLTQSALYRTGAFVIQSVTSRLCAKAVGTKPGMRVLDCCAAPGGKSFAMADEMQDNGRIDALDLHEHRIKLIENEARRLNLSIVHARRADASELPDEMAQRYDAVLCDAPCSGLSAAGKPEIALRTTFCPRPRGASNPAVCFCIRPARGRAKRTSVRRSAFWRSIRNLRWARWKNMCHWRLRRTSKTASCCASIPRATGFHRFSWRGSSGDDFYH